MEVVWFLIIWNLEPPRMIQYTETKTQAICLNVQKAVPPKYKSICTQLEVPRLQEL